MRWCWLLVVAACGFSHGSVGGETSTDGGNTIDARDAAIDAAIDAAPDARPDAPPPPPPVALVQATDSYSANGGIVVAATYPSAQVAHHFNLVVVGWVGSHTLSSIADTNGNTYTHLSTDTQSGETQDIYYAPDTVADASSAVHNTITATFTAASTMAIDVRIVEYAGLANVGPVDATAFAGASSGAALDSGAATTSNAHDLLVGISTCGSTGGTAGTSYTQDVILYADIIEHQEVITTSDYHATETQTSGSQFWMMRLVALKAAP